MRYFPSKERFRVLHISSLVVILSIFTSMFLFVFSLSSSDINVPCVLTGFLVHFRPKGLDSLHLWDPNHISLVFSTFSLRPEMLPNSSSSLSEFCTEVKLFK